MSQYELVRQCRICHSFSQPVYRMSEYHDDSPTGRYCDVCHSCLHSGQKLTYQQDPSEDYAQQDSTAEAVSSPLHASSCPVTATPSTLGERQHQQLADSRREVFQALTNTQPSSDTIDTVDTVHPPVDAAHFSSPTPPSRPAVVSRTPSKARRHHPDA